MKNVFRQARYWVAGIACAALGVLIARWAPTHATPALRLPLTIIGQLVAVGGLLLISIGVSRRVRRDRTEIGVSHHDGSK